ncbi:hypothetical protein EVG20_g5246 [Dentipellis fragilis]|uniref:Uncharacterized protein n=1 Tax=Dentipellis fragilis TaxID=205917 RepID=A0A4Y9YVT4_9AGAM|nr:hypothetical protein EVG20_g5246 [Dentipellis fragilis]
MFHCPVHPFVLFDTRSPSPSPSLTLPRLSNPPPSSASTLSTGRSVAHFPDADLQLSSNHRSIRTRSTRAHHFQPNCHPSHETALCAVPALSLELFRHFALRSAMRHEFVSPPMDMSTILLESHSQANVDRIQVVTTTVWAPGSSPTAGFRNPSVRSDLPIGAIVGGVVGGVILALFVVAGWTWWGRCLKRREEKQRTEMHAILAIRENTRRNASSNIGPPAHYQLVPNIRAASRKVRFAPLSSGRHEPLAPSNVNLRDSDKPPQIYTSHIYAPSVPFARSNVPSRSHTPAAAPLPPGAAPPFTLSASTYFFRSRAEGFEGVDADHHTAPVAESREVIDSAGSILASSPTSSTESWHSANPGEGGLRCTQAVSNVHEP